MAQLAGWSITIAVELNKLFTGWLAAARLFELSSWKRELLG